MARKHVVPIPGGKWAVKTPKRSPSNSTYSTQNLAKAAKQSLKPHGGGEAIIHRPDGRIRDADAVAPAKDPNPSNDTKD